MESGIRQNANLLWILLNYLITTQFLKDITFPAFVGMKYARVTTGYF